MENAELEGDQTEDGFFMLQMIDSQERNVLEKLKEINELYQKKMI
jgi:hypothetical protein